MIGDDDIGRDELPKRINFFFIVKNLDRFPFTRLKLFNIIYSTWRKGGRRAQRKAKWMDESFKNI